MTTATRDERNEWISLSEARAILGYTKTSSVKKLVLSGAVQTIPRPPLEGSRGAGQPSPYLVSRADVDRLAESRKAKLREALARTGS